MDRERSLGQQHDESLPLAARIHGRLLGRLASGTLTLRLPGAEQQITGAAPGTNAHLQIHRPWRLLLRLASRGAMGFAESYIAGEWDSTDLTSLLRLLTENEEALGGPAQGNGPARPLVALYHLLRANTPRGSRRNIAAHYDLGNDFYAAWLDRTMTYSAALFDPAPGAHAGHSAQANESLEQAQERKYARMLERLGARPGQHILEIGCGWGGFGRYAARHGVHVTGLTLSREQLAWAQNAAREDGLDGQLTYRLRDYRAERGTYDHVVSIEMVEAVGERYWSTFFNTMAQRLKPGGRAALQVITIDEPAFDAYRRSPDFIQRYIFPGGMLPTQTHLHSLADACGLETAEFERFGLHYAQTLACWRTRFEAAGPDLRASGLDERFLRMWRYYLAYCEVGFRTGRIDLVQMTLQRESSQPSANL